MQIDLDAVLSRHFPRQYAAQPAWLRGIVYWFLSRYWRVDEINRFLQTNERCHHLDLSEKVLDYLNVAYSLPNLDRENIPPSGAVMLVANHPLGALDALVLVQLVSAVRRDIKLVVNDLAYEMEPLRDLMIPLNSSRLSGLKNSMKQIQEALKQEQLLIVFPSTEVSRATAKGIRDGRWKPWFLKLARKYRVPVLPTHIEATNTQRFYWLARLLKRYSGLLLLPEMFRFQQQLIRVRIGGLVPARVYIQHQNNKKLLKKLRKHVYRLPRTQKLPLPAEQPIALPESRQAVRTDIRAAQLLGYTRDKKGIYLYDAQSGDALLREIGRLRELTFRKVDEGTDQRRDLDKFDLWYRHIVLWDDDELEVVGAYRIAQNARVLEQMGQEGLYLNTLFELGPEFKPYLKEGIELGRSFVQSRYWGSRALDYLWQGIGAYLRAHPEIRYLVGPVSIPVSLGPTAKDLIVSYYRHYYQDSVQRAHSRLPYEIQTEAFDWSRYAAADEAFNELRKQLALAGAELPMLYKQYTDLCETGGVHFHGFNVDPEFKSCVDGLISVDLKYVKAKKRQRYLAENHQPLKTNVA